jgi:hypothetical protein
MNDANDRPPGMPNGPSPQSTSKIRHTRPGVGPSGTAGQDEGSVFRASVAGSPAASSLPSINEEDDGAVDANSTGALPVASDGGLGGLRPKIVALGTDRKHEEEWRRTPNTTGSGAIHVRTFHAKLTDDALVYMDRLINEWLDAHPQYEVKFVNASIGVLTGKIKEPHLICQVWV